ncbi:crossover junction endodeoxyribonuclease RuvC [Thermogemmatispora carboxidivorans]|uniref:crossover junction endodeoxyribonuclease RuvC n=1 Tax=Thermogemmatispora carboxidivorans TaxID=1382306 RepID=UPI00069BCF93|nr:crossover junction endodeoxyribonuclease RuvC [Thermogemmatispora carboxidivorans]
MTQKTPPRRVALGIDPGTAIVGYAVVAAQGDRLSLLACDVITTPAGMPLPQRLQQIYERLGEIISLHQPAEAAMEELFFAKNARTAMMVGQARGVAMLALANHGLPIAEYTPRQVKQAVTGYGSADKAQVGEMVRILLNLRSVPRPDDAADAAAIAICHLHSSHLIRASLLSEDFHPSESGGW